MLLVRVLLPFSTVEQQRLEPPDLSPPTSAGQGSFALVLGGGGARGFAHVGVLRGLESLGLVPAGLVGVSMGAVVAAMQWALPQWFASPALAARLAATAGTVLMAMIVYFGLVILTGGLDRQDLMRAVRRRRKPPAKPQA